MDVRQIIEALGTKATAAATGAVSTGKYFMAYIKQVVTLLLNANFGLSALKDLIDASDTKIDTIDGVVDAIKAKTDNLPTDPADQSLLEAETDAIKAVVDAIQAKTDNLPVDPANQSAIVAEIDENEVKLDSILSEILGPGGSWTDMQGESINSLNLALQYLAGVIGMNAANTFTPVVGGVARTTLEKVYSALDVILQIIDANIDWIKEAAGNDNWGFGALRNYILVNKALIETVASNVDWIKEAAGNDAWGFGALRNEINANEAKIDALENLSAAQVATALNNYDAVKRSEATTDKNAIITEVNANETKIDVITALVDTAETDTSYSYTDGGGEQTVYEVQVTTRRKISFGMDINAMTEGGVVKVYIKLNGTNYRVWIKQNVDSIASGGTEDVYTIEVTTNQHFKVTYEEDADEGATRAIPYSVVTQVLE